MSQTPLSDKIDIERKTHIPDDEQTADRDKAADVIDEMWPANLNDIAEASGYSRQHIRNVISLYYERTELGDDESSEPIGNGEITITVPEDVDPRSYLRGVADSLEKAN